MPLPWEGKWWQESDEETAWSGRPRCHLPTQFMHPPQGAAPTGWPSGFRTSWVTTADGPAETSGAPGPGRSAERAEGQSARVPLSRLGCFDTFWNQISTILQKASEVLALRPLCAKRHCGHFIGKTQRRNQDWSSSGTADPSRGTDTAGVGVVATPATGSDRNLGTLTMSRDGCHQGGGHGGRPPCQSHAQAHPFRLAHSSWPSCSRDHPLSWGCRPCRALRRGHIQSLSEQQHHKARLSPSQTRGRSGAGRGALQDRGAMEHQNEPPPGPSHSRACCRRTAEDSAQV